MKTRQRGGAPLVRSVLRLAMCVAAIIGPQSITHAQKRLPPVADAPALPEPIYWKQDLFLVPYQWSSAAGAGSAHAVWLFVSKDRGVSWQKVSEAKANVTSFNYRAEGDGEYWFAVRTVDKLGQAWPHGPYQPELRVIVDTTLPQISELAATQYDNGLIEIVGRASDANLDLSTLKIDAQLDANEFWQPVSIQTAESLEQATIRASWQPASGCNPRAIRATVLDSAGNPATYQVQVIAAPPGSVAPTQPTTIFATPTALSASQAPPPGWISSSTASAEQPTAPPTTQPWPAVATHRSPFRLFSSGPSLQDDGVTAYGNPSLSGPQPADSEVDHDDGRVPARYAGAIVPETTEPALPSVSAPQWSGESALNRLPAIATATQPLVSVPESDTLAPQHTPREAPKLVGSRTFALEYDLDDMGRWGVTKVELWGTRDGGRTWHSYARDDDHRSPLIATVDDEGLYGFRIVVESAGTVAQPPTTGDEPELWVDVDLHRPVIELTAIEPGSGNLADHLTLRWKAADDNLEARPISLFYSSRPTGPWSAIATNLEDTGEYSWRVERHVPDRFYLRAEALDTAGNLAAFQTREPIQFSPLDPRGRLRDADSVGPTATGLEPSYR